MARGFSELSLIESLRERGTTRRGGPVRLGIGDDCAVLRPPRGSDVLVTTDFTLEGRHFRRDWHPADSVGHRCLARGLSDLAAMGAEPLAAFLSLALPRTLASTNEGRRWVKDFFRGLKKLAAEHAVELAGGDTAEAPGEAILADIVLVGAAPRGKELRRSGARAGDRLYVSGALGGAAAELRRLRLGNKQRTGEHPQLYPEPRLAVGVALRRRGLAVACLDLSDGLSSDLAHLCTESGVGAVVRQAALPVHPLAAAGGAAEGLKFALDGGEDYELLFAARPETKVPRSIAGVAITEIGWFDAGKTVRIEDTAGRVRRLRPGGWEHFSS